MEPEWTERLEGSRVGRRLISALIVAVLSAAVVSSLPSSELRRVALPVVRPLLGALGLSQSWGMFAPDPPRRSTELVARIQYADGSVDRWTPPRNDPVVGTYRTYHWRKWATAVLSDRSRRLWRRAASWIAQTHDHAGRHPVRVELVRRTRPLPPPGSERAPGAWAERVFYVLELGPGGES